MRYNYYVIQWGSDCDGIPAAPEAQGYYSKQVAEIAANNAAYWSDGIRYQAVDRTTFDKEYRDDYQVHAGTIQAPIIY